MHRFIRALLLVVLSAGSGGCASYFGSLSSDQRKTYCAPIEKVLPPGEGEALIYFIRVGKHEHGWALLAAVYDGDDFAGIVPANRMFPYYADSGKHLFMVYADAVGAKPVVRFLQAEVHEGKTYYVIVCPNTLSLSGGFYLSPLYQNSFGFEYYYNWIIDAVTVGHTANACEWAELNRKQVLKAKAGRLRKWNAKPDADKLCLAPDDNLEIDLHKPEERK